MRGFWVRVTYGNRTDLFAILFCQKVQKKSYSRTPLLSQPKPSLILGYGRTVTSRVDTTIVHQFRSIKVGSRKKREINIFHFFPIFFHRYTILQNLQTIRGNK